MHFISAMILNLSTPSFSRLLPHPSHALFKLSETCSNRNNAPHPLLIFTSSSSKFLNLKASVSQNETSNSNLLDQQLLHRIAAAAKDADEALQFISDYSSTNSGVVSTSDCCSIISASLERNNHQLALSVFYSMRSTFHQGYSYYSSMFVYFSNFAVSMNWLIMYWYQNNFNLFNSFC